MMPDRRTYLWIGLALGVFVVYGSLVPFAFQPRSVEEVMSGLAVMLASPTGLSLSDVAVNVLLGVPLAFALCGAFCLDRPGMGSLLWGSLYAVAVGLLVSIGAEVGQIFVADRTASLADVAAQMIGGFAGVALWWIAGPGLTAYLRRVVASRSQPHLFTSVLTLYAAGWFLSQWLPLDLITRPSELLLKYRQGRLVLALVAPGPIDVPHLTDWMVNALAALPVGALVTLAWTRNNRMRAVGYAAVLGALAVTAAEVLQVFVFSRSSESFDAVVASCGAVVGVLGAHALGPGLGFDGGSASARRGLVRVRPALVVWMSILFLYHWSPFDFDVVAGIARWPELSFVPFGNYESTSAFLALKDLVTKVLLAFPIGLMVGMLASGRRDRHETGTTVPLLAVGTFFLIIEAGQLCLPARVPDVTDVLTQGLAAAIGVWIVFRHAASVPTAERESSWGRRPEAGSAAPYRGGASAPVNPDFKSKNARGDSSSAPGSWRGPNGSS